MTRPALLCLLPFCLLPFCLLLAAAAPPPAAAQPAAPTGVPPADHPLLAPSRDAVVAYHVAAAGGEPINVGVAFRAGGKALRLDLPDASFLLAFPLLHEITMVVPLQRTTADLGWADGPQSLFLLDDHMKFTRKADQVVAGQKCTGWDAALGDDHHTVCVTADGLVLRNQSQDPRGRRNLVEAIGVRYEPVPDAAFQIPPGFETIVPGSPPGSPTGSQQ